MRRARITDDNERGHYWLWVAAGGSLGLLAGVLAAEKMSGRDVSVAGLTGRGKDLAARALDRWEPLVDAVRAVRDAWAEEDEEPEDDGEDPSDEEGEEEVDDEEEDDDDDDDDDDEDEEPELDDDALDARVLVAFTHDPVLANREVEIEVDDHARITLHGRVHRPREVQHAVTIARGVPGVASVRQRLTVRDRR